MIRAAVFDVDELLISLEPQHKGAERLMVAEMGHDYDDLPHDLRTTSGRRVWDIVADMHAHFGWSRPLAEVYARRQQLFKDGVATADLIPMPGADRAVRLLHEAGYLLAVASSGARHYLETVLGRLDLLRLFNALVSGEDVARGKPAPEPYLLAAQRLGVAPGECIVFEDAEVGVRSAKAAGAVCIGVPNPAALRPQDLSLADLVLPSLEEFSLQLVDQLNSWA